MLNSAITNSKKVGIYVVHGDDAILGAGGRIAQHLKKGR